MRAATSALCLALLGGLTLGATGCQSMTERQRALLDQGEQAFSGRQYDVAADRLTQFLNEVRDRPAAARGRYVRGMALALRGQRNQAYADLERAATDGDPDVAWRALAVLGVLHWEDQHWTQAARAFGQAVARMPVTPPMDGLLYRLGLSEERSGNWAAALEAYRRLAGAFPASDYQANVSRRLALRADHFAVQCGVFAQASGAQQLAADLNQRGQSAYIRQELRDGETYHVVLVGRYSSYERAALALTQVQSYMPGAVLWP